MPSEADVQQRLLSPVQVARSEKRLTRPVAFVAVSALFSACGIVALAAILPVLLTTPTALLKEQKCGYWISNTTELSGSAGLEKKLIQYSQQAQSISNASASAMAYVRACYGEGREFSNCDVMINRRIPWTATRNSTCPFNGNCVGDAVFTMDTGNVTVQDFGINSRSKLSMRRQGICAAIKMDPYQVKVTALNPVGGYAHLQYKGMNATQIVRNDAAFPYLVNSWYPQADMKIHSSLQPTVGNTSIIYISRNRLIHLYRTSDPIYSAMEELQTPMDNTTVYIPNWEQRLGAIACVEKLQLCNDFDDGRKCSNWTGVVRGEDNNQTGLESFRAKCKDDEKGVISLLFPPEVTGLTIGHVAIGSGPNLIATQSLLRQPMVGGSMAEIQTARGEAQWELEVSQWFNLVLASMQLGVLYIPIGAPFQNKSNLNDSMKGNESNFICHSIKFNTFRHTSIGYMGVIIIIVWVVLAEALSHPGRILGFTRWKQGARLWENDQCYHPHVGGDPAGAGMRGLARNGQLYVGVKAEQQMGPPTNAAVTPAPPINGSEEVPQHLDRTAPIDAAGRPSSQGSGDRDSAASGAV